MKTWKIRQDGKIVDSDKCEYYVEHYTNKCGYTQNKHGGICSERCCSIKNIDSWQDHLKKIAGEISDEIFKNMKGDAVKYTPEERKAIREKHGLSLKDVHEKTGLREDMLDVYGEWIGIKYGQRKPYIW